jgi:hypothetical protein
MSLGRAQHTEQGAADLKRARTLLGCAYSQQRHIGLCMSCMTDDACRPCLVRPPTWRHGWPCSPAQLHLLWAATCNGRVSLRRTHVTHHARLLPGSRKGGCCGASWCTAHETGRGWWPSTSPTPSAPGQLPTCRCCPRPPASTVFAVSSPSAGGASCVPLQ